MTEPRSVRPQGGDRKQGRSALRFARAADTPVAAQLVAPVARGARCRLEAAGIALEVDGASGGRVVELSRGGSNALLEASAHREHYGSTFWTSPQNAWGWPPPAEIDRGAYRVTIERDRVVLHSAPAVHLGVAVTKTFSMTTDGAVLIEYSIENVAADAVQLAPWEVTRVARRGVSFFGAGDGQVGGRRPAGGLPDGPCRASTWPMPEHSRELGIVWVDHSGSSATDAKLFADGAGGWLAHAADGLLFLKLFDDVPDGAEAPGEAEVEIYVSSNPPYVELEQQGGLTRLARGDALHWSVEWRLVALPSGVTERTGDGGLIELVQSLAASRSGV